MTIRGLGFKARLESLAAEKAGNWTLDACGVTRSEAPLLALVHRNAYLPETASTRVLMIGGLSGGASDVEMALRVPGLYVGSGRTRAVSLSAVPCGNPDGLAQGVAPGNGAGGVPSAGYPPADNYFDDAKDPESRYLWRWACFQAPDLVLEVRAGSSVAWEANGPAAPLAAELSATPLGPADSLLAALGRGEPSGLAPVPGLRLTALPHALEAELDRLWSALSGAPELRPSPARRVLDARRARTPVEVARVLASVYGHGLDPVVYTQGVAISGRLRLAQLDQAGEDPVPEIERLVDPLVSGGGHPLDELQGTANLAGLLWAEDLVQATGDHRYDGLVLGIADRYRPAAEGEAPPPSDPDFRTEDMFMNGAILGRAFGITGDRRYVDLQTRFLLDAAVQQDDGLFWHCRSAPYYWGRGNGFAALGFAETLSYLPEDHPDRDAVLGMHLRHLDALRQLQRPSGMFGQVLDFPGSYDEFTAACMIGYAVARGIGRGWLDASYREVADLAWQGVSERIDGEGNVVDGCTGTGAQASLRDYLDRPAIHGFDDRSGSMALWFATEPESLRRASR